jgi:hypothetical protein
VVGFFLHKDINVAFLHFMAYCNILLSEDRDLRFVEEEIFVDRISFENYDRQKVNESFKNFHR